MDWGDGWRRFEGAECGQLPIASTLAAVSPPSSVMVLSVIVGDNRASPTPPCSVHFG